MKIQAYAKTLLNVFQYVHIMLIVKCRWFDGFEGSQIAY